MSCSDNIVSKEYLEQRLAQLKEPLDRGEVRQVVQGLVYDREIDFSGVLPAIGTVIQGAIDGLAVLLGLVPGAFERVKNLVEKQQEEKEQEAQELNSFKELVIALSHRVVENQVSTSRLEERVLDNELSISRLNTKVLDNDRRIADIDFSIKDFARILERYIVEFGNFEVFQKKLNEDILKRLEEIAIKDSQQDTRLDFLDESFIEYGEIIRILTQEYGEAFAEFAVNDADFFRENNELRQAINRLERQPRFFPTPQSSPRISGSADGSAITIQVTTDAGSDVVRIPIPASDPAPSLNPRLTLSRSGQILQATLTIANRTTSDTVELPRIEESEPYEITRVIERAVNLEELTDLARRIEANQSGMFGVLATVGTIGINTFNRVDPARLAEAAATGACNTLNGGCGQNFRNQIKADGVANLQALDTAGTAGLLAQVGKVQQSVSTLTNRLGIDRAMHAYNLAVTTHNAICLSRAAGSTLGYIVDNVALASGFEWLDTEGSPISFSSALGNTFQGFIQNAVGQELYSGGISNFNKLLRVYQTGQNVAWSVRGIVDPIQNIAVTAADNTGKIGNALRQSGAVLENSYTVLPEQNTVQSATQAKLATYTASISSIGEGLELFGEVTENVIEIQQNTSELQASTSNFEDAITASVADDEATRNNEKTSSQPPDISLLDLVPQPID